MKEKSNQAYWFLIATSLALPLMASLLFPIITDEAYYIDWATRSGWPRLGFFDHPPFVSWLAGLTDFYHHIFAARFAVWIFHLISIFFVWQTARIVIPERALAATLLIASTLGAIANGFLLTPDAGIISMWSVALHESVLAIRGQPRRWLTAGLVTGLGLWSKYTMVLIGPVFLWGMLRDDRKQLRTPWPYLGGVICALVFAPHLWWQSQNNWVTFKFQFGHGFSLQQAIDAQSTLPVAKDPAINDIEARKFHNELFTTMSKVSAPVSPRDWALAPSTNSRGSMPMPTRLERWMRS
jgi:4-amino-4-deoxy-L-arabinose transferase-like glycosyltransferase